MDDSLMYSNGVKVVLIFIWEFEIQEEIFIVHNGYLLVVVYLYQLKNSNETGLSKAIFTPDFFIIRLKYDHMLINNWWGKTYTVC